MNVIKLSLLSSMPDMLRPRHLIQLGFYRSIDAVYMARKKGHAPDSVLVGIKIFFPKEKVIKWLLDQNPGVRDWRFVK